MKILHLNTWQDGGAAWCAIRINKALVMQGVESKFLFAQGDTMPEGVEGAIAKKDWIVRLRSNHFLAKFRHLLMRIPWYMNVEKLQTKLNNANTQYLYLHQPLSYYSNIFHHPLVEWADIIHLHWVPDFVDYPTFFKKINRPIVWTLHDMYPAIGVMHFESENTVRPKELDEIDALCRRIKKNGIKNAKNLNIVAISEMMKDIIHSSELLGEFPVSLIHNGVDIEIFKPVHAQSIVSDFVSSLKKGTKVFLFSSYWIWDKRKGLDRILEAFDKVKEQTDQEFALIVIGCINDNDQYPKASYPILCTGLIKDQNELAKIYTAADYFINASYEEAFAQTPLEAMACGTPVISTPCSGAKDLIHSFNGVVCDGYDCDALAIGIENALHYNYESNIIREYIVKNYDYSIIAKQYIELYNRILLRRNSQ